MRWHTMRRMDPYTKAVAEIESIEQEIARLLELQRRRDQLRAFVDMGDELFQPSSQAQDSPAPRRRIVMPQPMMPRKTIKSLIIEGAVRLIRLHGPMQSRRIAELLEQDGVELRFANKALGVSTILSRESTQFKSDRAAGGWIIIESPHKEVTPQGAVTPEGSDLWNSQPEPERAPETATGQTQ